MTHRISGPHVIRTETSVQQHVLAFPENNFAALNKVETVPYLIRLSRGLDWTHWRLIAASDAEITGEDIETLDFVAGLTTSPDASHRGISRMYEECPELQAPAEYVESV